MAEKIKVEWFWGVGRRKTSTARVRLGFPGTGALTVNKKTLEQYFPREAHRKAALQALELTGSMTKCDLIANVRGGGMTGQAGAVLLGSARALVEYSAELRSMLSRERLLTRDPRMVERKKYGQPGARRQYQFSKR